LQKVNVELRKNLALPVFFQACTMESAHLTELIELEGNYWWHVAKRKIATGLLRSYVPSPARIVEGGIGAAGNLLTWKKAGYQVSGLDIMEDSIAHAKELGIEDVHKHDLHEPWPVEENSVSGIVLLDVLEHLADPAEALRQAARTLTENGKIIFTVPAYPFLFSDWDERLGHFRRYTPDMLREHVTNADLNVEKLRYWNSFTFPAAIAIRSVRKLFPSKKGTEFPRVSNLANKALIKAAEIETKAAQAISIPFGLSLVGVIGK
jgi:SAM-dependent methyltransferase